MSDRMPAIHDPESLNVLAPLAGRAEPAELDVFGVRCPQCGVHAIRNCQEVVQGVGRIMRDSVHRVRVQAAYRKAVGR